MERIALLACGISSTRVAVTFAASLISRAGSLSNLSRLSHRILTVSDPHLEATMQVHLKPELGSSFVQS
ncbi:hypothetical protein ACP4OV_014721 [Aristida adscensionis]